MLKATGQPPHPWLAGRASGTPIYMSVADGIAAQIRSGTLRVGDRLPPQRALARELGVTLSTITEAYAEATRRHLIGGEVGRGTYVLARSTDAALFTSTLTGFSDSTSSAIIDLSANVPTPLPDDCSLADSLRELSSTCEDFSRYPTNSELAAAAHGVATWMRPRGICWDTNQIVLTAGAQQALFVALIALAGPGSKVLAEAVTFPGVKAAARQLNIELVPVQLDEFGMIPSDLSRQAKRSGARVVVCVPCLQNPTGVTMNEERQADIARVVHASGLTMIEDDVYGSLQDAPALSSLLTEHAVTVSSLSKTVAPGLRLGAIGGDPVLVAEIREYVQLTSWMLSPTMLRIATQWLSNGTASDRLAWQRDEMIARWRLTNRRLGHSRAQPSPHRWHSTNTMSAEQFTSEAQALGVKVVSADLLSVSPRSTPHVRISLSAPASRSELDAALASLALITPPAP
jgi:DNA-binding transcriptional MocR family regulator